MKIEKLIKSSSSEYSQTKPGTGRIRNFLRSANIPSHKLPIVHIAGTNGKGSVAQFINCALIASGLKVGMYTSPHLIRINERIKINNTEISNHHLGEYLQKYGSKIEWRRLTFFEKLTAMGIIYFIENEVDVAIMEVGLGGLYDATNVCKNKLLSIITTVDYDHSDFFGRNLKKILSEDLGILTKTAPVIIGEINKKIAKLAHRRAAEGAEEVFELNKDFSGKSLAGDGPRRKKKEQSFDYTETGAVIKSFKIRLIGKHQVQNASIAVKAALLLKNRYPSISMNGIRKGLADATWPARFDVRRFRGNTVIVDGSHNISGIKTLIDTYLSSPYGGKKAKILFAVMKDKDYREMIKETAKLADSVELFELGGPRSLKCLSAAKEFAKYLPSKKIKVIRNLNKSISLKTTETILATGSLYLAGELLKIIETPGKGEIIQ